jgi:hypothetical protein
VAPFAARRPPASIRLSISEARDADIEATDLQFLGTTEVPLPATPVVYGDGSKAVPGRDTAGDIRSARARDDEGVVPGLLRGALTSIVPVEFERDRARS